jgi:alkylation response protein AidB-like acyl-CoA dehydrogenase
MGIALTEEQAALARSVAQFTARHAPTTATRSQFPDLNAGGQPAGWSALAGQGLLGLHLPEWAGGDGAGPVELCVVLEEAARGLFPGPLLPTLLASALVDRHGQRPVREELLPRFVAGATGAVATGTGGLMATRAGDGWEVSGRTEPVLGAAGAEILVLGAGSSDGDVWFVVPPASAGELNRERLDGVDLTRDIGQLELTGLRVDPAAVLAVDTPALRSLAALLASAEAAGVARWCQEAGLGYAKVREQFGRTIGSFQAVKHKCARLFIQVELCSAAVWDAASAAGQDAAQFALAAASAATLCLPAAVDIGLETVTLFGGIGYTWEHDAHLYWRRAISLAGLLGPRAGWDTRAGELARTVTRVRHVELDHEPDGLRTQVAERLAEAAAHSGTKRRVMLADAGLVSPHYPRPYGLGADATAQVVIAQEYERAGMVAPSTTIGEWALPTILAHGTDEQREYFVQPTLRGELVWCQLFSEPGAGSDLASLSTRAQRVEGGWRLNGQKVWTSSAHEADWGICLARTDRTVAKHKGLSYFLVDMRSPGLEVRPLREANGGFMFNEVFFTDVFVPEHRLVGEEGNGWRLARTTLGNERVSMGTGLTGPRTSPAALAAGLAEDPAVTRDIGRLVAQVGAFDALGQRSLLRRLSGLTPGAEASVLKVVASWNVAEVARTVMGWYGPDGAAGAGQAGAAVQRYLSTPPQLIGGGTTEIQLNVISERVLGLPRE